MQCRGYSLDDSQDNFAWTLKNGKCVPCPDSCDKCDSDQKCKKVRVELLPLFTPGRRRAAEAAPPASAAAQPGASLSSAARTCSCMHHTLG